MLPDEMINELVEEVRSYFCVEDHRLERSATHLLNAGFGWDEIRSILSGAYWAGHDAGYRDGGEPW